MKYEKLSDYLQKADLIFQALAGLPLLVFVFFYLRYYDGSLKAPMYSEEIGPSLGIAGLALLLLVAGMVIYEKKVASAREAGSLRQKMDAFYKAAITKYVLMSLGCLVVGVGYYLTGHQILVATYMVTLIAYTVNRPTIHRLIRKLKLGKEEREILKANEPIA
ncbi:hypothetical protein AB9P05_14485 [Roseivirga sp. BDSF3-8]|uniref:hypothetical protein n=1 Tax=Roseivirga sp. BDSF3-8 TaxID=3241598 RepID=UPI0035321DD0